MSGLFGIGGAHNCGDSRLTCIDCSGPLCPKCMVQCPVGNRCPKCAGRFTSHILEVSPLIIGRTLLASVVIGYAFGIFQIRMGFYGFIILYALGVIVGNLLHRIAGYKMGPKIVAPVVIGMIAGAVLSPTLFLPGKDHASISRLAAADFKQPAGKQEHGELALMAAKQKAQAQWNVFGDAFAAKTGSNFRVRAPLHEGGNISESLWLDVNSIRNDEVSGKVINEPLKLKETKQNQSASVPTKDVEDWIYNDGKQYVGGFSIHNTNLPPRASDQNELAGMETAALSGLAMYGLMNLALFMIGVLTPITGVMPPIRLPFSRF